SLPNPAATRARPTLPLSSTPSTPSPSQRGGGREEEEKEEKEGGEEREGREEPPGRSPAPRRPTRHGRRRTATTLTPSRVRKTPPPRFFVLAAVLLRLRRDGRSSEDPEDPDYCDDVDYTEDED
ncbi:unnamed protein product, partial [Urochloa humidicola]